MKTVTVQEAKTHLSRLLRAVEAGEEAAIVRAGRVIARLVPAKEPSRGFGVFEGQVRIGDDALAPMSDAEADEWEGGKLLP